MSEIHRSARRLACTAVVGCVVASGGCYSGGGSPGGGDAAVSAQGVAGAANGTWQISYVDRGNRRTATVAIADEGRYRFTRLTRFECYVAGTSRLEAFTGPYTIDVSLRISADGSRIDISSTHYGPPPPAGLNCWNYLTQPEPREHGPQYSLSRSRTLPSRFGRLGGTWQLDDPGRPCTIELRDDRISGSCAGTCEFSGSMFSFSLTLVGEMLTGALGSGEVVAQRR